MLQCYIITSWGGKKVTDSSHRPVRCNSIMHVLMCKVWVSEKQNITVFVVINFHINGRMITEVHPCIIFYTTICCLISAFLNCVLQHVVYSREPYAHLYYVNLLRYVVFTYLLQLYLVGCGSNVEVNSPWCPKDIQLPPDSL